MQHRKQNTKYMYPVTIHLKIVSPCCGPSLLLTINYHGFDVYFQKTNMFLVH